MSLMCSSEAKLSPADEDAVSRGCYFDRAAAERVREFFRRFLRHSKGREWAGKPFEPLPWQWEHVIKPIYGWKRKDGTRRFRKAYVEVSKKNGKSTLCAGLSLYGLLADGEPGAEVYSAATDRRQASIIFNEVVAMVKQSPALQRRIDLTPSTKRMRVDSTNSLYEALSADVPTKEGLNISTLIVDELHAHKSRTLRDTLGYGGSARQQPLMIDITTAGSKKEGVGWDTHEYARKIISGAHYDPDFYGVIFAAEEGDDWKDPRVWAKANPSLGAALKLDQFEADCREATLSPIKEAVFKRYRLGIWSEQSDAAWLPLEAWDACKTPVDPEALRGQRCYAGLDLSSTSDLTAFVLYFPASHSVLPYFWLPEDACRTRERLKKARLDQWIRQGFIRATPGAVVDYDRVRKDIGALGRLYDIKEIGVDRWNSTQLALQLRGDGFRPFMFGQGYQSMSGPMKRLEALLLSGQLAHGGQPVLRWNFENLRVETDAAENLKPAKNKSRDRIDGIVALLMAVGRAMEKKTSVYAARGDDSGMSTEAE